MNRNVAILFIIYLYLASIYLEEIIQMRDS